MVVAREGHLQDSVISKLLRSLLVGSAGCVSTACIGICSDSTEIRVAESRSVPEYLVGRSGRDTGSVCRRVCAPTETINDCIVTYDPDQLAPLFPVSGGSQNSGGTFVNGGAAGEGGSVNDGGALSGSGSGAAVGTGSAGGSELRMISVYCEYTRLDVCTGRRHCSWGELDAVRSAGLGGWFARAAANEAGSVRSFRALARELAGSRLRVRFASSLRTAARDEVRHARTMTRLARAYGARRPRQTFTAVECGRRLVDIALENVREGCVAETYAALEIAHQARFAEAELQPSFARIAKDEFDHAQLSWDLWEALEKELTQDERRCVRDEFQRCLRMLESGDKTVDVALSGEERRRLGLPSDEEARNYRAELAHALGLHVEGSFGSLS